MDVPTREQSDIQKSIGQNISNIFHAPCKKADDSVPAGLMAVDFIVEVPQTLFLIEIKDFEHPRATEDNKKRDYKKLTDPEAAFPLEMGMKVKDSKLAEEKRYKKQ
jgi:hypothetical protein